MVHHLTNLEVLESVVDGQLGVRHYLRLPTSGTERTGEVKIDWGWENHHSQAHRRCVGTAQTAYIMAKCECHVVNTREKFS